MINFALCSFFVSLATQDNSRAIAFFMNFPFKYPLIFLPSIAESRNLHTSYDNDLLPGSFDRVKKKETINESPFRSAAAKPYTAS